MPRPPDGAVDITVPQHPQPLLAAALATQNTIQPVCSSAGTLIGLSAGVRATLPPTLLSPAQPCLCLGTRALLEPLQDPLLSSALLAMWIISLHTQLPCGIFWGHLGLLITQSIPNRHGQSPWPLCPGLWVQDLAPSQGLCTGAGAAPSKQSCTTIADFLFMLFFAFSSLALLIL